VVVCVFRVFEGCLDWHFAFLCFCSLINFVCVIYGFRLCSELKSYAAARYGRRFRWIRLGLVAWVSFAFWVARVWSVLFLLSGLCSSFFCSCSIFVFVFPGPKGDTVGVGVLQFPSCVPFIAPRVIGGPSRLSCIASVTVQREDISCGLGVGFGGRFCVSCLRPVDHC